MLERELGLNDFSSIIGQLLPKMTSHALLNFEVSYDLKYWKPFSVFSTIRFGIL